MVTIRDKKLHQVGSLNLVASDDFSSSNPSSRFAQEWVHSVELAQYRTIRRIERAYRCKVQVSEGGLRVSYPSQ